jgi:hypothetical protein
MTSTPDDLRAYFKAAAAAKITVEARRSFCCCPCRRLLLRSPDFTISQDRPRTANLLLSLHALAIALANKLARIAGSALARGRAFEVRKMDEAANQSA